MLDGYHSGVRYSSYLLWHVIHISGTRGVKAGCDIFIAFECPVQLPCYLCSTCQRNIKSDLCPLVHPGLEGKSLMRPLLETVYYMNTCQSETQWPSSSSRRRTPDQPIDPRTVLLIYIVTYICVTIDGVWIVLLDLLHSYTLKSQLQVITALPLIPALHSSLVSSVYYSLDYPFPGNGF
jgi:hypothetical protein